MADSATVCPKYHRAVELIGRRWAGAIVNVLLQGRHRFNEIAALIPDVSDRMLVERLRELEAEGVVIRIVVTEASTRVEYELTAKGRALEDAVTAISRWAEDWVTTDAAVSTPAPERGTRPKAPRLRRKRRNTKSAKRRGSSTSRRG